NILFLTFISTNKQTMTKIKKNLLSTLTVVLFFIIALASNPSKKTIGNAKKFIPEDFDPNTTTLLIEKFEQSNSEEQIMEEYMSEKYPYKYEFVDLKTIKDREGKYANTKLYRFALVTTSHRATTTKADGASTSVGFVTTAYDFHFLDRDLVKNYPRTKEPSG